MVKEKWTSNGGIPFYSSIDISKTKHSKDAHTWKMYTAYNLEENNSNTQLLMFLSDLLPFLLPLHFSLFLFSLAWMMTWSRRYYLMVMVSCNVNKMWCFSAGCLFFSRQKYPTLSISIRFFLPLYFSLFLFSPAWMMTWWRHYLMGM